MRTDVRIRKRKVRVPNSSTLAFCKYYAEPGDLIQWDQPLAVGASSSRFIGRVIGQVDCQGADRLGHGHLCVLAIGQDFGGAGERWVDPAHVWSCQPIRDQLDILSWILGDGFDNASDELRRDAFQKTPWGKLTQAQA